MPVTFDASTAIPFENVRGLDPRLAVAARETQGYVSLFPVQAAVWRELAGGLSTEHDLCICAPTGSGKTLSYALPVLQSLAAAIGGAQHGGVHLLRALVVLPTRDLAVQVSTGTITATVPQMHTLLLPTPAVHTSELPASNSTAQLCTRANVHSPDHTTQPRRSAPAYAKPAAPNQLAMPPAPQVYDLFRALAPACGLAAGLAAAQSSPAEEAAALVGPPGRRHQGVDILVATPGRLMSHLQGTAGLSLQVGTLLAGAACCCLHRCHGRPAAAGCQEQQLYGMHCL